MLLTLIKTPPFVEVAKGYERLGFTIYATGGTSSFLAQHGVSNNTVFKVNEGRPNVVDYIKNGDIHLVINTPLGETSRFDELAIGSAALEAKLPILTTVSAAAAVVKGIQSVKEQTSSVRSLQEYHEDMASDAGPKAQHS